MQHESVSRRLSVVALGLISVLPAIGAGQVIADRQVYTLSRAIDEALTSNPGIRAAGFDVEIATARRDLAALPAPMSVQAEAENFLGSGRTSAFDGVETTLQLSTVLELGGKRELRENLGNVRIGLAETDRSLARLDLAAEVARRFIGMVALQEELLIAERAVNVAASTLEIVRRRVAIGSNSEAELATAEIALTQADLGAAALETRIDSAGLSLATLWGADEVVGLHGQADFFDLPALPSLESLKNRIAGNPELLRNFDERRILEAERRLANTRERADLGLNVGLRRLEETNDTALVFGANLPLGRRARSAADVAASSAALDQLAARAEQQRLDVISILAGFHAELQNAYEYHRALQNSLLPRSETAAELYLQGFEQGSFSLLEFNRAQQDRLGLRREALTAAAVYHATLVDIEQLLGGTLESGVIQ